MPAVHLADNMNVLPRLEAESFHLIYIDPPFNTGRKQRRPPTRAVRAENETDSGAYSGFGGVPYKRVRIEVGESDSAAPSAYKDSFDDYLAFLEPRLREAHRLLTPTGSFFLHIDPREAHYCKVLLDSIFGRDSFMNEIIWAYDYGARSRTRWPAKHDTIFWYAKDPERYTFNYDDIDRIPYMAPGLVTPEKAARGKTPTDVWWNTIVSPTGKEKTGYPTQKPLAILERIIRVHSNPGDHVLDFFAGSGTTGAAAANLKRDYTLIDSNPQAIEIIERRMGLRAQAAALCDNPAAV